MLTPFVHGSYFLFVSLVVIYYLLGRFEKIWAILFIVSFVISTVIVELTQSTTSFLPEVFSRKVDFYTDSNYISERASGSGFWFVDKLFSTLSYIYINMMAFMIIFKNNVNHSYDTNRSLMRFLIILMTFSNIFMPVPSVGGRYIQLAYPIIAYLWLSYFSNQKYYWFVYALPFIWLMNLYHLTFHYINVLNVDFLISSPIYLFLKYILFS